MELKTVQYAARVETYSDNGESITLTAELSPGDVYEDVLEELKIKVHDQLNDNKQYKKYYDDFLEIRQKLRTIKNVYDEARAEYEKMTEFMKAQGIKQEFPTFPSLSPREVPALKGNHEF